MEFPDDRTLQCVYGLKSEVNVGVVHVLLVNCILYPREEVGEECLNLSHCVHHGWATS